jgi:hypothetical protein
MMAFNKTDDCSALVAAAAFAAGDDAADYSDDDDDDDDEEAVAERPAPSCIPLLFLLRRVAMQPQPCDNQEAHMSKVMEVLMDGPRSGVMFDDDQPDDARDECIRLLLEFGAHMVPARCNSPVLLRIVRDGLQMARLPHLLNEDVVGVAVAQQQRLPRH